MILTVIKTNKKIDIHSGPKNSQNTVKQDNKISNQIPYAEVF